MEVSLKRITYATAAFMLSLAPAFAQTQSDQGGLVNVNLQDVLNNLAADIKVDKNNIPVTAQVPVSVAANVCGLSVNVLSQQASSGQANCTAKTGSQQLTQVVQQQMSAGGNATNTTNSGGTASSTKSGSTAPSGSTASGTSGGTAPSSGNTARGTSGGTAPTANTTGTTNSGGTAPSTGNTASGTKTGDGQANTTGSVKGNSNSAREFAPGQRCDGTAKDCAPGHQANPQAAAPGQMKKQ